MLPPKSPSVEHFAAAMAKLFGTGLKPGDIDTFRNNDIDYRATETEVVISAVTPSGINLMGRKAHRRRGLRWIKIKLYVILAIVLAPAILFAWKGGALLQGLPKIALTSSASR
jgi:hypothetical protein